MMFSFELSRAGEREAQTFELDNLYREILLPDTEDLEIAEDRLLRFGMAIDLDTQEVALVLPVEFALAFPPGQRDRRHNNGE